jgi:single-stranded-DNA-specific exonuclease
VSKEIRRRRPDEVRLEGLHPVLAKIYAQRGVREAGQLRLGLDELLPPGQLAGLPAAAKLLADTVEAGGHLLIVGDFDADGATSTALAVTLLRQMGAAQVSYLVPNRFEYGYGLTPEIVEMAAQRGPDVIITVDNGISSIDGVTAAAAHGIRTLVTDHHLPGEQLPAADVIVNPNQHGCPFPSKSLAGVGVIFYVMMALRGELRERGWFEEGGLAEPNLGSVLDLVALGTVADVVPLDRNNRILVQQGLLRMRAGRSRPGIEALLRVAGREPGRLVAADLGFAVAPRLNAAGRLDDMSVGIECLLSEDATRAGQLAGELDTFNRDRQAIEVVPSALCLYDSRWHQGVVGILASRIKDRLHRPTIAFADGDGGELKGSARSIQGLHIRDALDQVATRYPGLVTRFGGHAMAAGLTLEREKFERFRDLFEAEVEGLLQGVQLDAVVESDGELEAQYFNLGLARELRFAGPWGQQFPEPLFDGLFQVVHQRLVGERHLKLVLEKPGDSGELLDAIAFNVDTDTWPDPDVQQVRLAYRLDSNLFRGQENLQLVVDYLEPA